MTDSDPASTLQSEAEHQAQRREARAYAGRVATQETGPQPDSDQRNDVGDGTLLDQVRDAIAGLTAPWTVADLADALGRHPDEIRSCVTRLVQGGTVADLGTDPRPDREPGASELYGPPPVDGAAD